MGNRLRFAVIAAAAVVIGACAPVEQAPSTTTATTDTAQPSSTTAPPTAADPSVATIITGTEDYPDGFTVPAGETWMFDPDNDTAVTAGGNVEVLGTLVMQPANGEVEHSLVFEEIDESAFVGGGMDPVTTDVGLWVMGDGRLLVEGEEKQAWGYEYDPAWEGDEVMATPNSPGDFTGFTEVTSTPEPNALGYPPELLNLSRNVRIEGTPGGHAHIFIRSSRPQIIRYAAIRYVGPDAAAFGAESDRTGRYGIHIHMSGEGSRGTIIEGVVIRDTKNHAFVPHASHGVTFQDTIAFNVLNEAYWWDPRGDDEEGEEDETSVNDTHDAVIDRAVAAGVDLGEGGSNFRMSAFFLGNGDNPVLTNSVAVGVQGTDESSRSGFHWPEAAGDVWTFENNIAHNNDANGIFVWQNVSDIHEVGPFTAYYNGLAGVEHGAYGNAYQYRDLTLLENSYAIRSHALGEEEPGIDTQTWTNIQTDGGTLLIDEHARPMESPVRFETCDFGLILAQDEDGEEPGGYDFVECDLEPEEFDLTDAHLETVFRVQRSDGTAYSLVAEEGPTEVDPFLP